ncbi:unnamed protein product [Didymodactylos carnosus]|uniref:Uncharacterized protein n=1 Tax=Didymodactylos carnosus TaxID=1234261 RepID=A0A815JFN3_9BILA|nr:unnamed protein product [Didymodactylos carnosus]CAF4271274.1 unnamed protein product [Didymodactylos carnosus]
MRANGSSCEQMRQIWEIVFFKPDTFASITHFEVENLYNSLGIVTLPFTPIKRMKIQHLSLPSYLTAEGFMRILECIPNIKSIEVAWLAVPVAPLTATLPLLNCTYLKLGLDWHVISLKQFEGLLKMTPNVKTFECTCYNAVDQFLDGNEWALIFREYYPELIKFKLTAYLAYHTMDAAQETVDNTFNTSSYWLSRNVKVEKADRSCIVSFDLKTSV